MKILWLCAILQSVFVQSGFGTSYWKNSRLCGPWTCLDSKLNLPSDFVPPRDQYADVLRELLPPGPWQGTVQGAAATCYGDRPRRYTDTCPGQALMHCTIDYLIQNCPEESLRKDDACTPVSSIAGFKYMFSQSRYENLEQNLPTERRPSWFMKNYFSSKCCNLPELFNATVLAECGFSTLVFYYTHEPRPDLLHSFQKQTTLAPKSAEDRVKVVDLKINNLESTSRPDSRDAVQVVNLKDAEDTNAPVDPLNCCDMSEFIPPPWRSECDFWLSWGAQGRLAISNATRVTTTQRPTTTTAKTAKLHDVTVVPLSCEQETCVFSKLNVVSPTGVVDVDAFSKLLDNLTSSQPSWTKAKARAITTCLTRPILEYKDSCDINKVLACVFDVLSENCPFAKKGDPCKHGNTVKNDITCQISTSKYRPKHRRQFCDIPNLVNHEVLLECGLSSINRLEFVPNPPTTSKPRRYNNWLPSKYVCKELTESTKCLMRKMGVLNKYGFMDYFKMKDRIRQFTSNQANQAWSSLTDAYIGVFTGMPMYRHQCSSPKKLLNVVDTMLMTCPVSKRRQTQQCDKFFTDIATTAPTINRLPQQKTNQVWQHFQHVFLPITSTPKRNITIHKKPVYDFGILNSNNAPPVEVIDVPETISRKPLVLLPEYMRMNGKGIGNLSIRPLNSDGVLRSDPFALHNKIAMAHTTKTN